MGFLFRNSVQDRVTFVAVELTSKVYYTSFADCFRIHLYMYQVIVDVTVNLR